MNDVLERRAGVLRERRAAAPDDSYVAALYAAGPEAMAAKIVEEAAEAAQAAQAEAPALVHEVADLWFHCLVLLAARGLDHRAVLAELERRFGVSGHAEKAGRGASGATI